MAQHDDGRPGEGRHDDGRRGDEAYDGTADPAVTPAPNPAVDPDADGASGERHEGGAPAVRPARLVVGAHLLTVNPVDGSEIEPCPPGERPVAPRKLTRDERERTGEGLAGDGPAPAADAMPVLEREDERERLARMLTCGRSVRVTGPSGVGRSTLLDAVAEDVAALAPDGVVRLSGRGRTVGDLLQELFAAVHDAPGRRPDDAQLRAALAEVGAVVVVDDLGTGGTELEDLFDATPECAFLLAATPDVPAPSRACRVEDFPLSGISRTGCLELLEQLVRRPLTDEEADWAADLWFAPDEPSEAEGLPLRCVQAGALLRRGEAVTCAGPDTDSGSGPGSGSGAALAVRVAAGLSEPAREVLRLALALDGALPHRTHLPALVGDPHAGDAVAELAEAGLVTVAGGHHRLAAGVARELSAAGYATGADSRALAAAQHYGWWTAHPSVSSQRIAAEADTVLAAVEGARRGGHASAAVLLARAAAPVLAATLRWSVWERVLRAGREAARTAGEVAEEAYFQHESGILALCTGRLEEARTALETSLGVRGVLADQQGLVAGRRALALVTDLEAAGTEGAGGPGAAGSEDVTVRGPLAGVGTVADVTPTVVATTNYGTRGGYGKSGRGGGRARRPAAARRPAERRRRGRGGPAPRRPRHGRDARNRRGRRRPRAPGQARRLQRPAGRRRPDGRRLRQRRRATGRLRLDGHRRPLRHGGRVRRVRPVRRTGRRPWPDERGPRRRRGRQQLTRRRPLLRERPRRAERHRGLARARRFGLGQPLHQRLAHRQRLRQPLAERAHRDAHRRGREQRGVGRERRHLGRYVDGRQLAGRRLRQRLQRRFRFPQRVRFAHERVAERDFGHALAVRFRLRLGFVSGSGGGVGSVRRAAACRRRCRAARRSRG